MNLQFTKIEYFFIFDKLTIFMFFLIYSISFSVIFYSFNYMKIDPFSIKFFSYLYLFFFFMNLLVTSSNFCLFLLS